MSTAPSPPTGRSSIKIVAMLLTFARMLFVGVTTSQTADAAFRKRPSITQEVTGETADGTRSAGTSRSRSGRGGVSSVPRAPSPAPWAVPITAVKEGGDHPSQRRRPPPKLLNGHRMSRRSPPAPSRACRWTAGSQSVGSAVIWTRSTRPLIHVDRCRRRPGSYQRFRADADVLRWKDQRTAHDGAEPAPHVTGNRSRAARQAPRLPAPVLSHVPIGTDRRRHDQVSTP